MLKLSRQSTHAEIITRAIGLFIAQDLWPYSIVENEGFRNMIHVLEPRYEIPSRPYFSNVVVPKIYQDIRAKVDEGFVLNLTNLHSLMAAFNITARFSPV
jgi:tRNA (cytidine32/guanosine34-2'-O)-methyltransferase